MKYLLITTLAVMLAWEPIIKKDKIMHFGAGYISAHAATNILPEYTDNKKVIKYGPFVACLVIGVTKELVDKYDSNPKSTFEWADIAYTAGGGITFFTISLDL